MPINLRLFHRLVIHRMKISTSVVPNENLNARFIDHNKHLVYGGDLSTPTPNQSVGTNLFNRLKSFPKDTILQVLPTTGEMATAESFLQQTVGFAQTLTDGGLKKGDYVLLVGDNTLNMNVALIGLFYLAAIPVPLSPRTDLEEFNAILRAVKPGFFGCDRRYIHPFLEILRKTVNFNPDRIFHLDSESDPSYPKIKGFEDFINGRGKDYESFQPTEVKDSKVELALVMKALTVGAPGRVVGITHHNVNSVIARYESEKEDVQNKILLMVQKVVWMSGIYSLISSCAFGAKLIIMKKFEEEFFLRTIDEYNVTTTYMYSGKWWLLYKHTPRGQYNLTTCTQAYCIDGYVPKNLTDGLQDRYGMTVLPCYGITEMTGLVLKPIAKSNKEGSVGQLVPQVYGKVTLESSKNGGPNEIGELCFKGPVVSLGYLNNKKANQALFDKDGYLLSGQCGYYDEVGEFFIIDTILYQIKFKDFKIFPKELEGIIKSLEAVRDVCVSGIKHPDDGEYPIAFVVLEKGHKLTEDDIIKFVNDQVPDHKKLRGGVVFLPKIPRFRETGSIKRKLFIKALARYRMRPQKKEQNT